MKSSYPLTGIACIAGIAFFASLVMHPSFERLVERLGKNQFYVYVVDAGKRTLAGAGAMAHQTFLYHVPATDGRGTEKTLTFTSDRQLSLDTYVRLYVSSAGKVTAWEEVPTQELPERMQHDQGR
jgi:uncharacterized protein (TIGR01655 family)